MNIQSVNPVNGQLIKTYKEESEKEVGAKLERARSVCSSGATVHSAKEKT